jgi:hypothetical protein
MRRDYQIAIVLAVAALAAGTALMAAPEYLHLGVQSLAVTFWGGVILTALLIVGAVAIALRGEAQAAPKGHSYRMIAILGMAVCGAGFMAFAILFFVQRPSEDRVVQSAPSAPPPIVKTPIASPPAIPPPPIPPPPPISPEKPQKQFVDANVTAEFLVGLNEGQTALGAETRAAKYIGKWMPISGPLLETMGGFPIFQGRSPVVATLSSQGPHVVLVFHDEWIDRLAMISKNQNISVFGQIKEVGRSRIVLDPCEFMDSDPATSVPVQSPNATTRPRRRRSPKGKRDRPPQG